MKKYMICFFTLMVCLLSACSLREDLVSSATPQDSMMETTSFLDEHTGQTDIQEEITTERETVPVEFDDKKESETSISSTQSFGKLKFLSITNYTDYLSFLEKNENIPDDFITFEMLQAFGSFKQLVCPGYYLGSMDTCYYYFNNSVSLYVYKHDENKVVSQKYLMISKQGDMRMLDTDATGNIVSGDMIYYYKKGKLDSIKWIDDGKYYHLRATNGLQSYISTSENDIILCLLDSTTAADALASIKAAINEPVVK